MELQYLDGASSRHLCVIIPTATQGLHKLAYTAVTGNSGWPSCFRQSRLQVCHRDQDGFLCPDRSAALVWTGIKPVTKQGRCTPLLSSWHCLLKPFRPPHSYAGMAELWQLQIAWLLHRATLRGPDLQIIPALQADARDLRSPIIACRSWRHRHAGHH